MNALVSQLSGFVEQTGWLLVNSLWQFTVVALLAAVVLRLLRRHSASSRYVAAIAGLSLMVLSPVMTYELFMPPLRLVSPPPTEDLIELSAVPPPRGNGSEEYPVVDESFVQGAGVQVSSAVEAIAQDEPALTAQPTAAMPSPTLLQSVAEILRPWLPTLVAGWVFGIALFSFRPLLGWRTVWRLRTVGHSSVPDSVQRLFDALCRRLKVSSATRITQSALVTAPLVIGWLKPIVLLPVSVVAGLPTPQLEAILAHELAHVRRFDYVVNVMQALIETVFFYHPAIWWLSRRIRIERENCCDDLAVSLLDNRLEYGRALLAVSQLQGSSGVLAVAADGGSLPDRVRRLVVLPNHRQPSTSLLFACVPLLFLVMAGMSLLVLPALAQLPTDSTATVPEAEKSETETSRVESSSAERMSDDEQAVWQSLHEMGVEMRGEAGTWQRAYREFRNRFPAGTDKGGRSNERLQEILRRPVTKAILFSVPDQAWPQIAQLSSMQELEIGGSTLAEGSLSNLTQVPNLRKLAISSTPVLPEHLREIAKLRQLEDVSVMVSIGRLDEDEKRKRLGDLSAGEQKQVDEYLQVSGPRPRTRLNPAEEAILLDRALTGFDQLTQLRRLKLTNGVASAGGLLPLRSLPLEELYVNVMFDAGGAAEILGDITSLKSLAHVMSFSDSELGQLAGLRNLKDLDVGASRVTSIGIDHLLGLQRLERLDLASHSFSNDDVARFAGLPALRALDLTHSQGPLTTEGVAALRAARPGLQVTVDDDLPHGLIVPGARVGPYVLGKTTLADVVGDDMAGSRKRFAKDGLAFDFDGAGGPRTVQSVTVKTSNYMVEPFLRVGSARFFAEQFPGAVFRQESRNNETVEVFTTDGIEFTVGDEKILEIRVFRSAASDAGDAVESPPTPHAEGASPATDARPETKPKPGDTADRPASITVTGRVFDPEGNAIAGARVFITSPHGGQSKLGETETDATGHYEFRNVELQITKPEELGRHATASGQFEVFGMARGHGFVWRPAASYSPDAEPGSRFHTWPSQAPEDDPNHVNLDLHFWPSAPLRGRAVDGDGNPLPGTKVGLWDAERMFDELPDGGGDSLINSFASLYADRIMPPQLRNRVTDDDGWFEYEALPADTQYRLEVRPEGMPPRTISAVVGDGEVVRRGDADVHSSGMVLVFEQTVEVPVLVTHADTGQPAPDVAVNLYGNLGSAAKLTDAEGRATLKMPPGNHKLHVLARTGTPYLPIRAEHTIDADVDDRTLQIELQPAAEVVVTVVDSTTGEPLSEVDFWQLVNGQRSEIAWRSFTAPNLSKYNRPATDKDGKATLLFAPGEPHTFGAGLDRFPQWYLPSRDEDAATIDGTPGRHEVTVKLRRAER